MNRKKDIGHFRDLEVYQRAFKAAMEIFQITKDFPGDEKYSMVDQMRRSSRSVALLLFRALRCSVAGLFANTESANTELRRALRTRRRA